MTRSFYFLLHPWYPDPAAYLFPPFCPSGIDVFSLPHLVSSNLPAVGQMEAAVLPPLKWGAVLFFIGIWTVTVTELHPPSSPPVPLITLIHPPFPQKHTLWAVGQFANIKDLWQRMTLSSSKSRIFILFYCIYLVFFFLALFIPHF